MPSATSSPMEPVGIASISTAAPSPSFMIEPLPNARSIWPSAASNAFCLSMEPSETMRSAALAMFASLFHTTAKPMQCELRYTRCAMCTLFVLDRRNPSFHRRPRVGRAMMGAAFRRPGP